MNSLSRAMLEPTISIPSAWRSSLGVDGSFVGRLSGILFSSGFMPLLYGFFEEIRSSFLYREVDAALLVHFFYDDRHFVPDFNEASWFVDSPWSHFRDMDKPFGCLTDLYERSEVEDSRDFAFELVSCFVHSSHVFYDLARFLARAVFSCDIDRSVVFDVYLGACHFFYFLYCLAAGSDDEADLVRFYLDDNDLGRVW